MFLFPPLPFPVSLTNRLFKHDVFIGGDSSFDDLFNPTHQSLPLHITSYVYLFIKLNGKKNIHSIHVGIIDKILRICVNSSFGNTNLTKHRQSPHHINLLSVCISYFTCKRQRLVLGSIGTGDDLELVASYFFIGSMMTMGENTCTDDTDFNGLSGHI
jgi:hypothetical protein